GDEQILPAVAIEIRGIDTHAGTRLAIRSERYLSHQAGFFPAARPAIEEQEIRLSVIRDEEIHPAIVVDIGGHHTQRFAQRPADFAIAAHFRESAVAVISIKEAGGG